MRVKVELSGERIGENNILEVFEKKTMQILLTFSSEDGKSRNQFVLSGKEAESLVNSINKLLFDEDLKDFKIG